MGARHTDAAGVQPAYIAQHDAALHAGDAPHVRFLQLRVILVNGGGVHHHIRAQHVLRSMAHIYMDPHGPLRVDDGAFVHVAAGDGISLGRQNLHQRKHAAAADADEMQAGYPRQKVFIEPARNRHSHKTTFGHVLAGSRLLRTLLPVLYLII